MRIACPSCSAEYEVPASRLTPRKMVRCARCGGEWTAVHEAEEVESNPIDPPEPEADQPPSPSPLPVLTAMDRLAASPAPPRRNLPLLSAWVVTCLVLAGAAGTVAFWRNDIIRVWPQTAWILGSSLGHKATPHDQTTSGATGH